MEFKDRLRAALVDANYPIRGMAPKLAAIMKVSPKAVGKWLSGESMPTTDKISDLARITGVSGEWLLTGMGKKNQDSSNSDIALLDKYPKLIPIISWVQAGELCETIDNFYPGDADEWIPCPTTGVSEYTYALRVVGDSMTSPFPGQKSYPSGTIIFVDPYKNIENGSRIIAKDPETGKATFKQYSEESGRKYLRPLNPQYKAIEIFGELHVCGVVTGSYQEE